MSLIKKPNEIPVKKTIVGAIYGQPGVGKTSVALSLPRPLLLDTDNGLYRVQAEYRCDSVPVTSFDDILAVLKEDLSGYDTIVIDTLGKLIDFMCEKVTKDNPNLVQKDGTMAIKAWGLIKNDFKKLIKEIQSLNKNFILVAHEKETSEGDERIIRPDVAGSAGKDIIKELDFLGYMEIIGKKRSISFAPSEKFYAKNSLSLAGYVEVPILEKGDKNTFLTDYILNPTIQRRSNEFVVDDKYTKVLEQAKTILAKGKDITPEDIEKLRKLPVVNDSKQQIKAMLDKVRNA